MSRIAIIGGGLAGITAALCCADAGHAVMLLESRPVLGGLTTSFRRGDITVDNGQHVFLRCCTSYLGLLRRLGVEDRVRLQDRLDIAAVSADGRRSARLRRNGLPAPLHLAGALLRYTPLSRRDRLRAIRGALALRGIDPADRRIDDLSFGDWLAEHGQRTATVDALWDLFTVATLNSHARDSSLGLAAMVFTTALLTDAQAGDIGYPLVPLQQLHGDAALAALAAVGAETRTKAKVDRVERTGRAWRVVERAGRAHDVDQVVLAAPPATVERLLPAGSLDRAAGWSDRLGASPIVNVHVVYDRPVLDEPFLAGVGSLAQWVFDRTLQSGLGAGQYLAVSISAADAVVDSSTAQLRAMVLPELERLIPRSREAGIVDFFVTRERQATFRAAPGVARWRPGSATRHPGLVLAGAWTDTGWPATMEGAVRSGELAAAALDPDAGAASPPKGMLAA